MPEHFYVYPAYLAQGRSRAEGRRRPSGEGIPDVTVAEIAEAARRLGYRVEVEAEKSYPRDPTTLLGRVKVTKRAGSSKTGFLKLVAAEVRRHRGPAGRP